MLWRLALQSGWPSCGEMLWRCCVPRCPKWRLPLASVKTCPSWWESVWNLLTVEEGRQDRCAFGRSDVLGLEKWRLVWGARAYTFLTAGTVHTLLPTSQHLWTCWPTWICWRWCVFKHVHLDGPRCEGDQILAGENRVAWGDEGN